MAAKRKIRVDVGALRVTIYRWEHKATGRKAWRFAWKDSPPPWKGSQKPWQYTTTTTQAECEDAARAKLTSLQSAALDFFGLSTERQAFLAAVHRVVPERNQAAVLASLTERLSSAEVKTAVDRFTSFKITAKGHHSAHLEQVKRDLDAFALHFAGHSVAEIQLGPLADWWALRTGDAGGSRQKNIRGSLISFFNWAKREGMTGNSPTTVADRLPSVTVGGGSLYVLSREELAVILHHVRKQWLPWVVFGAFCGMRPEEIAPKQAKSVKGKVRVQKPGLRWEHVDWQFNVIRLPKEVSKGGKRARIIPLHPVVLEWFKEIGADPTWTGRVCLEDAGNARETKRLGILLDQHFDRATGWPDDSLRHSYASYRNAEIRNLQQVAEEMGNSETMLHAHYHNPKSSEEGAAWFELSPAACSDLFRSLQKSGAKLSSQKTA